MNRITIYILVTVALMPLFSCKKDSIPVNNTPTTNPGATIPTTNNPPSSHTETDYGKYSLGFLAGKQGIKLGAAFTYWEYRNNPQVAEILNREFKAVTFGNEMKHDAIVQWDGSMNFTTADQMASWAREAGADLFGHVLGWHSQQQTTYLNNVLSSASSGDSGESAPIDGGIDFERYQAGASAQLLESGQFVQINGPDYVSVTGEYAHSGSLSLKMDNSDAHSKDSWDVQVVTKSYPVTPGKTYRIAWYGRASREADLQIDIRGDGDVQYKSSAYGQFARTGTDWTAQYLDYQVQNGQSLSLAFYGAVEAVTYYIDDIQIIPKDGNGGITDAARAALDAAFKDYVYGMVQHFDVYAWDVVNETFADGAGGAFRTRGNSQNDFVWGNYYPSTKHWVDTAFTYATEACALYGKKPVLYINDYNLETDPDKRKGLCNYAKGNPKVTGVSSQMHLDINTPDLKGKIEASLKDLAATGKMVRIAELDLKNNDEKQQAEMIKFIFQKYLEIVPAAQRGGITFWGINDKDSWLGEESHGLLWKNGSYDKKEAYKVLYDYLCEINGISE